MHEIETDRPTLPQEAKSLPARYYIDPEFYRLELEWFFFGMWVHAGRADEIPNPGDFLVRDVAGESVIVVRRDGGELGAFYNVCGHRGTRLTEEKAGRFASTIQCPYHAWTYDWKGCLLAAPKMDRATGFRLEDYPLRQVAVDVWAGNLFLNLADVCARRGSTDPTESPDRARRGSPDPAAQADRRSPDPARPLLEQLSGVSERFHGWRMDELRLKKRIVYDVAANWKLIIHNYSECLHCPGVHPALQKLTHYLSGENEPAEPGVLGGRMRLRDGIGTLSFDGQTRRACLPGLTAEECRYAYFYASLPNLLLSMHPDYAMTHTLWPRGVGRTEIVCEWLFHPSAIAAPDFDIDDAVAFWDLTNRQDWHVCEQMQLGLGSRAYRPGPYSHREELLYGFDQLILDLERKAST
jgi:glycine betaine catabolism A